MAAPLEYEVPERSLRFPAHHTATLNLFRTWPEHCRPDCITAPQRKSLHSAAGLRITGSFMQLPMKPLRKPRVQQGTGCPAAFSRMKHGTLFTSSIPRQFCPRFFSRCPLQLFLLFPVPGCSFGYSGLFRQPAHGAARVTARFLLDDFQQLSDIFVHGFPG